MPIQRAQRKGNHSDLSGNREGVGPHSGPYRSPQRSWQPTVDGRQARTEKEDALTKTQRHEEEKKDKKP